MSKNDLFSEPVRQSHKLSDTGERLAEARKFESALDHLNRAIDLNPTNDYAYRGRGFTYRALGQPERARADLTRAVELNPSIPRHNLYLGIFLLDAGEAEQALPHLSQAVEDCYAIACELDVRALLARALAHIELGQVDRAIDDLSLALSREFSDPCLLCIRARLHLEKRLVASAIEDLIQNVAENGFGEGFQCFWDQPLPWCQGELWNLVWHCQSLNYGFTG